jgi:hypothetical protein
MFSAVSRCWCVCPAASAALTLLEAIIDEFLIKIYCASMCFKFFFYSFNIDLMQSFLIYAVVHFMFYIKVGQNILPCTSRKLSDHLGRQSSFSSTFLSREAIRNKCPEVLLTFLLGKLRSSIHRFSSTPGVLDSLHSKLWVTFG